MCQFLAADSVEMILRPVIEHSFLGITFKAHIDSFLGSALQCRRLLLGNERAHKVFVPTTQNKLFGHFHCTSVSTETLQVVAGRARHTK